MKILKYLGVGTLVSSLCLLLSTTNSEAGVLTAGKQHIGTFNGSTTFTTSSSNGINPGLFIEVRDVDGKLKQYTSEDGSITVPNTKEGAYVTQAKLLGKTKYVDQDTGEVLDTWEEGRNLKLESSKMPVLTTTGKNLFDMDNCYASPYNYRQNWGELEQISLYEYKLIPNQIGGDYGMSIGQDVFLKKGHTYNVSFEYGDGNMSRFNYFNVHYTDGTDIAIKAWSEGLPNTFTITPSKDVDYVWFCMVWGTTEIAVIKNIQIEEKSTATSYEPYKSNILTTSEEVELRGIGDVKDELNLLTGELTERIGEVVFDGNNNEYWQPQETRETIQTFKYTSSLSMIAQNKFICDRFPVGINGKEVEKIMGYANGDFYIAIKKEKISELTNKGLKEWLSENPTTVQYQLATESVKTVDLNSTYEFNFVGDSVVQIDGEIIPTIYSITVPSEPLTFAINPNATREDERFIAPEFSITNESAGPIQLELKSFEQLTTILNDVLPNEHNDWDQLNKIQSKDIALALVPIHSDGWLSLNEGPKYAVETSNTLLGEIKRNSTVDFTFSAYHGGVFEENLFPKYRLVFTFGF